jgi:hypothetical protein
MTPKLQLKDGVSLNNIRHEAALMIPVCVNIFGMHGVEAIITSGTDGTHSPNSLHYKGLALDWRTRHLEGGSTGAEAGIVRRQIAAALGPKYDVVLEQTHIHVEYDPA